MFQPSRTVAVKTVVPLEQLGRANAILDTTMRTIRILAPMTISLLASVAPLATLFFVNAASYLFSACFLYAIRGSLRNTLGTETVKMTPGQYWQDIAEGLDELKRSRPFLHILLFSNLGFLVWQVCWNVGFPFLANEIGQGNSSMLAVLIGFYGIGNLLGSLCMARAFYTRHLFVILIGWGFQSGGSLLFTLGPYQHWIAYLAAAVSGVGGPLIGIPTVTAIQTKATAANTGKVFAINMLIFTLFCLLSSSLGAVWLGKWPVEQLFLVSGLFLALMTASGFVLERRDSRIQAKRQSTSV